MTSDILKFLRDDDLEALRRGARSLRLGRGDVVVHEGNHLGAVFFIRSGSVYAQQKGVTIARLAPGELFGEIGFLEGRPATASLVAGGDAVIDRIDAADLEALLSARPALAERFYHSLAVGLAQRVRTTSRLLSRLRGEMRRGQPRGPLTATGRLTAPLVPAELADALLAMRTQVMDVETALRARGVGEDAAAESIGGVCDRILETLATHTTDEALVELNYSDLLAFNDGAGLREAIGGYVFRDTFWLYMQSTTIARCHGRPSGTPEDYETMSAIYEPQANGDGAIGPLVDRWFLQRPLCRGRRDARDTVTTRLARLAAATDGPLRVCCLASGTARGLLDAMSKGSPSAVTATCIDFDPEALRLAAAEADEIGVAECVNFLLADVRDLGAEADVTLEPQDLIYASGLLEFLPDDDVVALLDWCHDQLAPGGHLIFSNLTPSNGDMGLIEHILQWRVWPRDAGALTALVGRSRRGAGATTESVSDGGVVFATVRG